jgi:hypothetical protein
MKYKSMQWTIWAVVMSVFTLLTLMGRWLDLALALTLAGVFWYGIVPGPQSDENEGETRSRVKGR